MAKFQIKWWWDSDDEEKAKNDPEYAKALEQANEIIKEEDLSKTEVQENKNKIIKQALATEENKKTTAGQNTSKKSVDTQESQKDINKENEEFFEEKKEETLFDSLFGGSKEDEQSSRKKKRPDIGRPVKRNDENLDSDEYEFLKKQGDVKEPDANKMKEPEDNQMKEPEDNQMKEPEDNKMNKQANKTKKNDDIDDKQKLYKDTKENNTGREEKKTNENEGAGWSWWGNGNEDQNKGKADIKETGSNESKTTKTEYKQERSKVPLKNEKGGENTANEPTSTTEDRLNRKTGEIKEERKKYEERESEEVKEHEKSQKTGWFGWGQDDEETKKVEKMNKETSESNKQREKDNVVKERENKKEVEKNNKKSGYEEDQEIAKKIEDKEGENKKEAEKNYKKSGYEEDRGISKKMEGKEVSEKSVDIKKEKGTENEIKNEKELEKEQTLKNNTEKEEEAQEQIKNESDMKNNTEKEENKQNIEKTDKSKTDLQNQPNNNEKKEERQKYYKNIAFYCGIFNLVLIFLFFIYTELVIDGTVTFNTIPMYFLVAALLPFVIFAFPCNVTTMILSYCSCAVVVLTCIHLYMNRVKLDFYLIQTDQLSGFSESELRTLDEMGYLTEKTDKLKSDLLISGIDIDRKLDGATEEGVKIIILAHALDGEPMAFQYEDNKAKQNIKDALLDLENITHKTKLATISIRFGWSKEESMSVLKQISKTYFSRAGKNYAYIIGFFSPDTDFKHYFGIQPKQFDLIAEENRI